MSRKKPRAIIVGGSLGGLFAANMLRQVCGWDVDVYERVENDLAARGAGIATHDEMFEVMRKGTLRRRVLRYRRHAAHLLR
jgi:2-polyprenyl-6-methoxyphenol hydroxylase-like FAD-dependent oxidoreductase